MKKYPYFPTLLKLIETAKPRPRRSNTAMSLWPSKMPPTTCPSRWRHFTAPDAALQQLQSRLETLDSVGLRASGVPGAIRRRAGKPSHHRSARNRPLIRVR